MATGTSGTHQRSPVFGSSLGSVIGSLQTLSWSAYSAGPHTARILLIPDSARYKGSTTVLRKYRIFSQVCGQGVLGKDFRGSITLTNFLTSVIELVPS